MLVSFVVLLRGQGTRGQRTNYPKFRTVWSSRRVESPERSGQHVDVLRRLAARPRPFRHVVPPPGSGRCRHPRAAERSAAVRSSVRLPIHRTAGRILQHLHVAHADPLANLPPPTITTSG